MNLDENWSRGRPSKVDSSHSPSLCRTPTTQLQEKIKLFSQAGYKLDTPPNPFICCQNNCTLTFLFGAYRKSLWKIKKSNDSDVGFIRATPLPLAEAGKSTLEGLSIQTVQQLMCLHEPPAALHRRISPSYHNVLGLWGHQEDPSRRMNSCLKSAQEKHQLWGQAPVRSSLLHIPEVSWN